MRRVRTRCLGALLLLPLLAACGFGAPKPVEPVQTPEGGTPVLTPPPVASTGSVTPIMGDWRPVTGESGQEPTVTGPGLFLVDAETGRSEFWPAPTGVDARVQLTPDSRYVWAATPKGSVVADRERKLSSHWNGERILLGIADGVLLWEELDGNGGQTGRFRLEELDGALIKSLTLSFPSDPGIHPHFTRNTRLLGSTFLISKSGMTEWRVDSRTGEATEGPWTDTRGASRFDHAGTGRQYGGDLYQNTLPFVTVTNGGEPEYRILAAYPSCGWAGWTSSLWRADGAGLLISSGSGPIMVDLPTGKVESLAIKEGEWWWDDDLAPSPTRNDRWSTIGDLAESVTLRSFGPGNNPVASGSISWERTGLSLDTQTPLWSADGRYLQFQAFLGGGKDFGCVTEMTGQPFLPPKVERAPFGEIAVQVATDGDCLNLRVEPSREARVLTCLRDGTRLTFLKKPEGGNGPYFGFYPGWALVQTGESSGWVSTEGGYLKWAD